MGVGDIVAGACGTSMGDVTGAEGHGGHVVVTAK